MTGMKTLNGKDSGLQTKYEVFDILGSKEEFIKLMLERKKGLHKQLQESCVKYYESLTEEKFNEVVKDFQAQSIGKPMIVGMGAAEALKTEVKLRELAGIKVSDKDIVELKENFPTGWFYIFDTQKGWSKQKLNTYE